MDDSTVESNLKTFFKDGPGPGLDPVGGEFQPTVATGYPGGGAYLVRLCQLSLLSRFSQLSRSSQFCQLKDIIDFND